MKNILLVIGLCGLILLGYSYRDQIFKGGYETIQHSQLLTGFSEKLHEQATLPEPLKVLEEKSTASIASNRSATLGTNGIIALTNKERNALGLPSLKQNSKLAVAAKAKLDDMFKQQYFEHESPDGKGPSDLAKAAGYEYVIVGENLALGNFENDQALVTGWMNSPGHRANILNTKYTEIGVAVGKGIYEGKPTWLAVQEFGAPLSSCPAVNPALKQEIDFLNSQINSLQAQAEAIKAELDSGKYKNDTNTYNAKVKEYNALVGQINPLVDQAKAKVAKYNAEVSAFNNCVK